MIKTEENGKKKPCFGLDLGSLGPNSGPNSVTRYHGQLSPCTISEKTNDQILEKFSDGWTDRQTSRRTDRQMDGVDFIGHCPTNFQRPKTKEFICKCFKT